MTKTIYFACNDESCPNFSAPYHGHEEDAPPDCPMCGNPTVEIADPDALSGRALELNKQRHTEVQKKRDAELAAKPREPAPDPTPRETLIAELRALPPDRTVTVEQLLTALEPGVAVDAEDAVLELPVPPDQVREVSR